MDTAITVVLVIIGVIFFICGLVVIADKVSQHRRITGGIPTTYTGEKSILVDVLMDAFYNCYPDSINVESVMRSFNRIIERRNIVLNPNDIMNVNRLVREIVFCVANSGKHGLYRLDETYITIIEALVACYFEKDCQLHDLKYINEGRYNSVFQVKCRRIGDKFDTLNIQNESENIIRVYKCKYNYLPNRTGSTKMILEELTSMMVKMQKAFTNSNVIVKPIYGTVLMTRSEAMDKMSLMWGLYPKLLVIPLPITKDLVLSYLNTLKEVGHIIHANDMVYGDWKAENLMTDGISVFLTDVDMIDIDTSVQNHWMPISHGMPFNIKDMIVNRETALCIDNYARIKDACSIVRAFAATQDEIDWMRNAYPFANNTPERNLYNMFVQRIYAPSVQRFGVNTEQMGINDFTDAKSEELLDELMRVINDM